MGTLCPISSSPSSPWPSATSGSFFCDTHNYSYNGPWLLVGWIPWNSTYSRLAPLGSVTYCNSSDRVIGPDGSDSILCRRWDDGTPTVTAGWTTIYPDHDVWVDSDVNLNFNPLDLSAWGPRGTIESGIRHNRYCTGTWCSLITWTIWDTYSQTVDSTPYIWNLIRYRVWDNSFNRSPIEEVIVKIDKTIPDAPSVSSLAWTDDIWSNTSSSTMTATVNTTWEVSPRYNEYCIDYIAPTSAMPTPDVWSPCIPNIDMPGPVALSSLSDGVYWFRVHTCTQVPNCGAVENFRIKIDTTAPTLADVSNPNPQNILATDNYTYTLGIGTANGSSIASIDYRSESTTTTSMIAGTDVSSPWQFSWDMRNVDFPLWERLTGWINRWSRPYTFQIYRICDTAWNCSTFPPNTRVHQVYANTITRSPVTVVSDDLTPIAYADGTLKNIRVLLEDVYGNAIIPTGSAIGRTIDVDITANNTLRLDQYGNTAWDSALFAGTPTTPIPVSPTANLILADRSSIDGNYDIPFYVFAPTSYISGTLVPWSASITSIDLDINRNLVIDIWDNPQDISTPANNIDIRTNPIFTTQFWGEVVNLWFIEGATQNSSIDFNALTATPTSGENLRLEFGETTGPSTNNPNGQFGLSINTIPLINEWKQWVYTSVYSYAAPPAVSQSFSSLLIQDGAPPPTLRDSYLASIIQYDISWKRVVYPHDIIWKEAYYAGTSENNTTQAGIKILWNTSSQNTQELVVGQFSNDVRILWKLTKSSFRRDIEQKVNNVIRNINPKTWGAAFIWATELDDTLWDNAMFNTFGSSRWESIFWEKVLYYGDMSWSNVTLGAQDNIEWQKTLVVENGNVYISWNIRNIDWDDAILWIIVLNGNIYIDPSVTDIHAILYSNRSVISYDWVNELDGSTNASILRDQLYIQGSIFSENTIGWSRGILQCPFYINSNCTDFTNPTHRNNAQKYDINFIRRYFMYDTTWDGLLDTPSGVQALGATGYEEFPLVIEYDPNIQNNPPAFFD